MRLREFFSGVAAKRLRPVEVDVRTSHQHEFNGINRFREFLGDAKRSFQTTFLYLDDEHEPLSSNGQTTWYDARENQPRRHAEYRLYFSHTAVSDRFSVGDLMITAVRPDESLLIIVTPERSSIGDQLLWLFGLDHPNGHYLVRSESEIDRDVDYLVAWVLESIGIEPPAAEADADLLRREFGSNLPSTRIFSAFARQQVADCDPLADPDSAIMAWLECEERYFRAFERMLVEERLRQGFVSGSTVDVDGFISFSLGVQNRRKSRAGYALENHLQSIFEAHSLKFERGVVTEGRSKPDFLFPGRPEYLDPVFPSSRLAILGAKATCKDRWRQILGEADRITVKHLVTLEPSISANQTDEMKMREVQLVLPKIIHATYTPAQQGWLWSVAAFIAHIRQHQAMP